MVIPTVLVILDVFIDVIAMEFGLEFIKILMEQSKELRNGIRMTENCGSYGPQILCLRKRNCQGILPGMMSAQLGI